MEDSGLRDKLALERTLLANERTFLAYMRTALSLLAAGAALLHFFPNAPGVTLPAWCLVAAGGITLAAGIFRFLQVRSHLSDSG
jgi:putative membrane protein